MYLTGTEFLVTVKNEMVIFSNFLQWEYLIQWKNIVFLKQT